MTQATDRTVRTRLPNLDGLRAFSVILVLLFHAQFLGVIGGYIGVSVFFTISGYLLTDRLLSRPIDRHAVVAYWGGRWRRIVPAAWTVLLLIVGYEWLHGSVPLQPAKRLWMNALGFANWFQLGKGGGYAALFQQADMMVHYWSLGVEQQVYLVLPLVLWLTARVVRGRWQLHTVLLLIVVSFVLPFVAGMSVARRTYYGTDTRAGEILVGVALAIAHRRGLIPRKMAPKAGGAAAVAALAGLLAIAFTVGPASDFIRHGLLPLVAVLSTLLIHAAVSVARLLGGVFEHRVSRFLGDLSYPIYLLHWPIIVVMQSHGAAPWLTFTVALAGAIALGLPIVRFVEKPIRRGSTRTRWYVWVATTAVLLGAIGLVVRPATSQALLGKLQHDAAELTPGAQPGNTSTVTAPPGRVRTPNVAFFGDSVALTIALAANHHLPAGVVNLLGGSLALGCGLVHQLEPPTCAKVPTDWRTYQAAHQVDLAVVASCQWELVDRKVPGVGREAIGQPEIDRMIHDAYLAAVDQLVAGGVLQVGLVVCPRLSQVVGDVPAEMKSSREPARVQRLDEIIRQVAGERPGKVVLIDLAAWMAPHTDDAAIRPDGSHYEYEKSTPFTDALLRILQPAIDATRAFLRPEGPAPSTTVGIGKDRVAIFGDALALTLATALARFGAGDVNIVGNSTRLDCGVVVPVDGTCTDVLPGWSEFLQRTPTDVAVVLSCQWELAAHHVPGVGVRAVGTPDGDAYVAAAIHRAVETLLAGGARTVVWMTCPDFRPGRDPTLSVSDRAARSPGRVAALDRIIDTLPSLFPGKVGVLDLAAWIAPQVSDARLRPDGAHFNISERTDLSLYFRDLLVAAVSATTKH